MAESFTLSSTAKWANVHIPTTV